MQPYWQLEYSVPILHPYSIGYNIPIVCYHRQVEENLEVFQQVVDVELVVVTTIEAISTYLRHGW